jgi:hypothetical protein
MKRKDGVPGGRARATAAAHRREAAASRAQAAAAERKAEALRGVAAAQREEADADPDPHTAATRRFQAKLAEREAEISGRQVRTYEAEAARAASEADSALVRSRGGKPSRRTPRR